MPTFELTTYLTMDEVRDTLRAISTMDDPGQAVRHLGVSMGSLTAPTDPDEDRPLGRKPTIWEQTLPQVLTHDYGSTDEAMTGLLGFWNLVCDSSDAPERVTELLDPLATRRLLTALLFVAKGRQRDLSW